MRENRIADSSQKLYRYATFSKRCCVSRKKKKGFETCQGTVAKNTVEKGLTYAYAHRQLKKRTFRSLWITRINAAVRMQGMTYSEFIGKLNAKGIGLNRKVLADLAMNEPKAFEAIVKAVK